VADTFLFRNNAVSTLLAGINDTDTAIFLATGEGTLFPSPAAGQRFAATLTNAAGDKEIVYCSAQPNADELTVSRGEESTTALSWLAGDSIDIRVTQAILEQILQGDGIVILNTNADQVDGLEAAASATPGALLALDGSAILQATVANALLLEGNNSAYHRARGNHTGTQLMATISDAGALATVDSVQQLYTGAGSHPFTVPGGVTEITVAIAGGGGGGGNGNTGSDESTKSMGGDSGNIQTFVMNVVPGAIIPITLGAGGLASADGADSTFMDSSGATAGTVDAASNANPCVISDIAHDLTTGDIIYVSGVGGMTEINDRYFKVTVLTPDTYELDDENSSAYNVFSGAGIWAKNAPVIATGGIQGPDSYWPDAGAVFNGYGYDLGNFGQSCGVFGVGGSGGRGTVSTDAEDGVNGGGGGGGANSFTGARRIGGAGGDGVCYIFW